MSVREIIERELARSDFSDASLDRLRELANNYIINYFMRATSKISLKTALWYGTMESGKTYSDGILERWLKEHDKRRRYYIVFNDAIALLLQLKSIVMGFIIDNEHDVVLDFFYDDALVTSHSFEKRIIKVLNDKIITVFRHIINGVSKAISCDLYNDASFFNMLITLRYATQKISVTNPVIRNAPLAFIKTIPNDPTDYNIVSKMIKGIDKRVILSKLRIITLGNYVDVAWKEWAIAVVANRAFPVRFHGYPQEPDFTVDIADYDDEKLKIYVDLAAHALRSYYKIARSIDCNEILNLNEKIPFAKVD